MKKAYRLPTKPGLYRAARRIKVWKGFKLSYGVGGKGRAILCTIPKGAQIVIPEGKFEDPKGRASALEVPKVRGHSYLITPVQQVSVEAPGKMEVLWFDTNIGNDCGHPGIHFGLTRASARHYASW